MSFYIVSYGSISNCDQTQKTLSFGFNVSSESYNPRLMPSKIQMHG